VPNILHNFRAMHISSVGFLYIYVILLYLSENSEA